MKVPASPARMEKHRNVVGARPQERVNWFPRRTGDAPVSGLISSQRKLHGGGAQPDATATTTLRDGDLRDARPAARWRVMAAKQFFRPKPRFSEWCSLPANGAPSPLPTTAGCGQC